MRRLKTPAQYFLAVVLSFFCANIIAFFYNHDAKFLFREGGPTKGVYAPGHFCFRSDEGLGFVYVDENGYTNKSSELAEGYILTYGKSHTNAVEVFPGKRYSDILNSLLADDERIKVYTVAQGGYTFGDLISGFKALISEFPESSAVIIEISCVGDLEELEKSTDQRDFSPEDNVRYLMRNQSKGQILEGIVKEAMPLVAYFVNYQIPRVRMLDKNAFLQATGEGQTAHTYGNNLDSRTDCYKLLDAGLKLIKSEYDGKIIILYHPDVYIDHNGSLNPEQDIYYDDLVRCCLENDIELCNVMDAFEQCYRSDSIVPNGFNNTSMGDGHLNSQGHEIIAMELYDRYFRGKE